MTDKPAASCIELPDGSLDLIRHEYRSGETTVALSPAEIALLTHLHAADGAVVRRDDLLTQALGYRPGVKSRAVDHAMARLRKKIERDPSNPRHLISVYGAGYRLDTGEPTAAASRPVEGAPTFHLPFIGRQEALAQLADRFDGARLITILGPGGAGKTRTSVAFAERVSGIKRAVFVGLETAFDRAGVVAAIAEAVGVAPNPGEATDQTVARILYVLGNLGPVLLVLDNLEQVRDSAAALVQALLDGAPQLRICATSRLALGLDAERTWTLPPLATDEAVALLGAAASTRLTPDGAAAPAAVLALLDLLRGSPLAVILAGSRLRLLSPDALTERLHRDLSPLQKRGDLSRHGALRATIAWSWALLEPASQRALVAASLFPGDFTVDDLSAVVAAADDDPTLDAVDALVQHHLVLPANQAGQLSMLPLIRTFAAEQLAARPDARLLRLRFAQHWIDRASGWVDRLMQRWDADLGGALTRAGPFLIASFEAAIADDPALAIRALTLIPDPTAYRQPPGRMLELLERALGAAGDDPILRGELLRRRAPTRLRLGDPDGALRDIQDAATLLQHADPAQALRAVGELGTHYAMRGDREAAAACYARIHRADPAGTDRRTRGIYVGNLGILAKISGDYDRAAALYHEALDLLIACGSELDRGRVMVNLGNLLVDIGRPDQAATWHEQATALFERAESPAAVASLLASRAHALLDLGQLGPASDLARRAIDETRRVGVPRSEANAWLVEGGAALESGRAATAIGCMRHAVALYEALGDQRWRAIARTELGRVQLASGDPSTAARTLQTALHEFTQAPDSRYRAIARAHLAMAHAALGEGDAAAQAVAALSDEASTDPVLAAVLALARARARGDGLRAAVERARADFRFSHLVRVAVSAVAAVS